MPALQGSQLAQTAKMMFKAKSIRLPTNFQGLPPQAPFGPQDQKVPDPNALFMAASTLSYHVDTAKAISKDVEDLIDACSEAIGNAFAQFQSSAKFAGVLINGPVGTAFPGTLVAPPVMSGPAIFSRVNLAGRQPMFIQYARSITFAIGTAFETWRSGYLVTLLFPGGSLCSVTMPPSPNVPVPVAAGASPGDALMTPQALKGMMVANHGILGNHALEIFDAMAQAFALLFQQWKAATLITNVIGSGGVAPPPPAPPAPVVAAIGNGGTLS